MQIAPIKEAAMAIDPLRQQPSELTQVEPGVGHRVYHLSMTKIWQCVKTNSTPVVHIKIAGIYGCE